MVVAKASSLCHQSWEYEPLIPRGLIVGIDGSAESLAAGEKPCIHHFAVEVTDPLVATIDEL